MLERFARMYAPALGTGPVMDYLAQTGQNALKGADILRTAPQQYASTVEYDDTPIAQYLRGVAQVTRPIWARGSSIPSTAALIPTSISRRCITSYGLIRLPSHQCFLG